ncbi:MAG: hypothetical protein JW925_10490 [Syntrophaceae bacterium]|nr:hypothetical protein [Syntrophaceae bacterium]
MIPGIILILFGLLLNQWSLSPFLHLNSGEPGILRIALIWTFDLVCIARGLILVTQKHRVPPSPKKIFFAGIMIVLMVLLMEFTLQIMTRISPKFDDLITSKNTLHVLPDATLGLRGNPEFPEHDSKGFRNKIALSHSEIVAIGDSQTYGTGVKRYQAWPQQLSKLSGKPVYNMSLGGYGSVEGLILLKTEALQLNPKYVIFMMYNGNDLIDAYDAVYNNHLYDTLKNTDSTTQAVITALQQKDPLKPKIAKITSQLWSSKPISIKTETTPSQQTRNHWNCIKQMKLFRLFFSLERSVQVTFFNKKEYDWRRLTNPNQHDSGLFETFESNGFRTILTPSYRKLAMDIEDPRIQEGLRISLEAIGDMKQLADSQGIQFLILLLPTKEKVFYELSSQYGIEPSESMQTTVKLDDDIRNRTMAYLQQHEISYINTLPILETCFKQKQQPYFIDADGHINPIGHAMIAKAVSEYIRERQH